MIRSVASPVGALGTAAMLFVAPLGAVAFEDDETPIRGDVVARLSVTVTPDESGTLEVPSPFAVAPDGRRVAIHVPESGGIFILEGRRILRHLPLPAGAGSLQDLHITESYLVVGRRPAEGRTTCELDLFDLATGELAQRVHSANPNLRCTGAGADLWRIVSGEGRVGVYHPGRGGSVPLWDRAKGLLLGADQMAGERSGIGLSGESAWVPNPDGSVSRKQRGRTRTVTGPEDGLFLAGSAAGDLFLLEPTDVVGPPGEGGVLLPPELRVRHWQDDSVITEIRLRASSSRTGAKRLVVRGRPVQVLGNRLFWLFVGFDFLEIRSMEIPVVLDRVAGGDAESDPEPEPRPPGDEGDAGDAGDAGDPESGS